MHYVYTDGACRGNPGPGGWAAIIVANGRKWSATGGAKRTTNNRMELMAVIAGLREAPASEDVTVYSDSQYVVLTMAQGWKRNKNLDLWADLDAEVAKRRVRWEWVRGHIGDPLNEEADSLARREAKAHAHASARAEPDTSPEHDAPPAPAPDPAPAERLTHVDATGAARMVDVGDKAATHRVAVACGSVVMRPETLALVKANAIAKGDVLAVARVAGIMGAKATPQLIPLCHPLPLDQVTVDFELDEGHSAVQVTATASTTARTGVEMEALTAVAVAALTIYDMCKAVDRGIRLEGIRLSRKSGGKSGDIVLE